MKENRYILRKEILIAFLFCTFSVVIIRLVSAVHDWLDGHNTLLEEYSFCVIFPVMLITVLSSMDGANTKEGLFMRFGAMIQLLLIISFPFFSLYLALGFPVVFLVVEIFVQKAPRVIYMPIERILLND